MQITKDVETIQQDFLSLMEDFWITQNIKEDFCTISSQLISQYLEELDAHFKNMKTQVSDQIQAHLLSAYLSDIDLFDQEFQKLSELVKKHGVINNRSLFQVFVDNLVYPYQI